MPPEALIPNPHYGLPLDVFSFGCVVCHVISQHKQWSSKMQFSTNYPNPWRLKYAKQLPTMHMSRFSKLHEGFTEVKRRQHYIKQISDVSLKKLVISCLDDDPDRRPPISHVCERITSIITGELTCCY